MLVCVFGFEDVGCVCVDEYVDVCGVVVCSGCCDVGVEVVLC